MTDNQDSDKPHVKYAESISRYKATQFRSSFAIPKELEPGLDAVVQASGANSLSDLIRCLASHPEEAGALVRPVVQKASVALHPKVRKKYLATELKELQQAIADSKMSSEQIAQLRAQILAGNAA